jgi:uncharacterized membrane protein YhaH (DUF805 family)
VLAGDFEDAVEAYKRGDYAVALSKLKLLAEQGLAAAQSKLGVSHFVTGGNMQLFGAIIALVLLIWPLWRICVRAGFPGAMALLALIPWAGLLIIGAVLSFAQWRTPAKMIGE